MNKDYYILLSARRYKTVKSISYNYNRLLVSGLNYWTHI